MGKSTCAHVKTDTRANTVQVSVCQAETTRGDQIEIFQILNGYENIDTDIFFKLKEVLQEGIRQR